MNRPVSRVAIQDLLLGRVKGDFLECLMSEVFSPYKFYIQLKYCDTPYDLDDLVDDMEALYSSPGSPDLHLPPWQITKDTHCAVKLSDSSKWYRATITAVEEGLVEVFLLDFGTTAALSTSPQHLRLLLEQFASALPAQAVRARLGLVAPPTPDAPWPEESSELLLELSKRACSCQGEQEAGLVARLEGWREGVPVLRLFDTVTNTLDDGLDLGEQLVQEGLASRHETGWLEQLQPRFNEMAVVEGDLNGQLERLHGLQEAGHELAKGLVSAEKDREVLQELEQLHQRYQSLLGSLLKEKGKGKMNEDGMKVKTAFVKEAFKVLQEENKATELELQQKQEEHIEDKTNRKHDQEDASPVGRLELSHSCLHLISWQGSSWVSSAELGHFQPAWRGYNLAPTLLGRRGGGYRTEWLVAREEKELWRKLQEVGVGGMVTSKGKVAEQLTVYRLEDLPGILSTLGIKVEEEDLATMMAAI